MGFLTIHEDLGSNSAEREVYKGMLCKCSTNIFGCYTGLCYNNEPDLLFFYPKSHITYLTFSTLPIQLMYVLFSLCIVLPLPIIMSNLVMILLQ